MRSHYRLDYIVGNNAAGIATCRACFWKQRATDVRSEPWMEFDRVMLDLLRRYPPVDILRAHPTPPVRRFLEQKWWPIDRITGYLDERDLDLVDPLGGVHDDHDPVLARCRRCGRISAARFTDFGSGCTCSRNRRSSDPSSPRPGRVLLAESDSEAVQWWDHDSNETSVFETVTVRARRTCNWQCPDCGFQFAEKVCVMTERPRCPDCEARTREAREADDEKWKRTPVADVPELAGAWSDDNDDDPRRVMVAGSGKAYKFRCANGHHPRIRPALFLTAGCPHCRGTKTATHTKSVAELQPELAAQWHPTRNGKHTPENVVWNSERVMWWKSNCCGHEWPESVRSRDGGQRLRCLSCHTILGSLAWHDPGLAAEWSPANPVTAWHVRPHASLPFVPQWSCVTNPDHVWNAPVSSRSNGAECPECRQAGKSRVELDHHAAALAIFGNARSGITIQHDAFISRRSWTTDISVEHQGRTVVIEYDGAYWHRADAKILVDQRKSLDLLAAGCMVVRLREDDLPSLGIEHPRYLEIRVHSTAPRPRMVTDGIHDWVNALPPCS
ncbi:MAG: zinc-ribbon domain-containing protein [Rhodococcus sp. (in: high G+C Gram-positive bacteria)]|uniref:zinc-ribbon domain-containing protein n=1 Tax=Rhodococcus sp. TaxID=1831 RepID=UPI003BB4D520